MEFLILLALLLAFRGRSRSSRHESSNIVDEKYLKNCLLRLTHCNDAYDVLLNVVSEQGHGRGTIIESLPLNISTALFSIESHSSAVIFPSLADLQGLNGRRIGSSVSSSMNHIYNMTATTSSEYYCSLVPLSVCTSVTSVQCRSVVESASSNQRGGGDRGVKHREKSIRNITKCQEVRRSSHPQAGQTLSPTAQKN